MTLTCGRIPNSDRPADHGSERLSRLPLAARGTNGPLIGKPISTIDFIVENWVRFASLARARWPKKQFKISDISIYNHSLQLRVRVNLIRWLGLLLLQILVQLTVRLQPIPS